MFRFTYLFLAALGTAVALSGQSATEITSYSQLEKRFQVGGDTTFVVNFWATWCKPCVAELPTFEAFHDKYSGSPVRVILVSLDFKNQVDRRLLPFLQEKNIRSEVNVLTDPETDRWIATVHKDWDGAIPATVVVRGGARRFKRAEFENLEQLEKFVFPK